VGGYLSDGQRGFVCQHHPTPKESHKTILAPSFTRFVFHYILILLDYLVEGGVTQDIALQGIHIQCPTQGDISHNTLSQREPFFLNLGNYIELEIQGIHYWVLGELGRMELRFSKFFATSNYKFLQLLQTIFFLSDFESFSSNQSI
jgi:hypothetical protein